MLQGPHSGQPHAEPAAASGPQAMDVGLQLAHHMAPSAGQTLLYCCIDALLLSDANHQGVPKLRIDAATHSQGPF